MMKIILAIIIALSAYGVSLTPANIDISKYDINKEIEKHQTIDVNEKIENNLKISKTLLKGDDYISIEDFKKIEKTIKSVRKDVAEGPFSFVLYFTSVSVPTNTFFNVLHSISILQDNGYKIYSKQYLIGAPNDFKKYLFDMNSALEDKFKSLSTQEKIKRNFGIKIDPRYFDYFQLKRVPAMALATCPSLTPDIEKCKFHYLMKGDVSLLTFLDRISETNKTYEPLTRVLIANQIGD